ncbi:MAG: pseudoazurin [Pseudomonadota bacterium]
MKAVTVILTMALALAAGMAGAETIEVQMLNKGAAGAMVFEPAFIIAQPGDTIIFKATDAGHNVEGIKGMLPQGIADFKSPMGEDYTMTVDAPGYYGIKCTPHYAMGMVGLIKVGDAANFDTVKAVVQKGKAKKRFEEIFAEVK